MNWIKVETDLPQKHLGSRSESVIAITMGIGGNEWFDASYDYITYEWTAHGFNEILTGVTHWAKVEIPT